MFLDYITTIYKKDPIKRVKCVVEGTMGLKISLEYSDEHRNTRFHILHSYTLVILINATRMFRSLVLCTHNIYSSVHDHKNPYFFFSLREKPNNWLKRATRYCLLF